MKTESMFVFDSAKKEVYDLIRSWTKVNGFMESTTVMNLIMDSEIETIQGVNNFAELVENRMIKIVHTHGLDFVIPVI